MNQPINDTLSVVDDTRISEITEIITPKELVDSLPLDEKTAEFIELSRTATSNIIHLNDPRLLVITGPCSIHNPDEALEFALLLKSVQEKNPHLFLVMRTYFEKPRTTVGWK
jgi:3-deoxy-7-phosphoheptulonate synthase